MEQLHKISQAYSQTPWRKQVRVIGIFLLALVAVATVASAYLNVRARTNALGRELQWMQVRLLDYYAITGIEEEDIVVAAEQATDQEEEEEDDIIPIELLERNISLLRTQLAALTSYQVMAARAEDLDLVPATPEDIVYLEIEGYVAPQSVVLAPPPHTSVVSAEGIDPAYRQSLFDWLGEQFSEIIKLFNGVTP